jgi:hypothetical protein
MAALSFVAVGATSALSGAAGEATLVGSEGGLAHPAIKTPMTSKNNILFIGNISFQTMIKLGTIFLRSYKKVVLEVV